LVVFNNFEIYVVIKVIKTIGQNLAVGWISIVIHAIICSITTPVALVLVSLRTQEAEYIMRLVYKMLAPIQKKLGK